jgi:DNA-binding PadR family transcriptional regulator
MTTVRLSNKEREILDLLSSAHGRELYGLELVAASAGSLRRGSVYVFLDRLEDRGLVESRLEERIPGMSGPTRRVYRVTAHGKRVLQLWTKLQSLQMNALRPEIV